MNAYRVGGRPGWGGPTAVSAAKPSRGVDSASCEAAARMSHAWRARLRGWLVCAAALLAAGTAAAQTPNTIEQVSVTRAASGTTIGRFQL